MLEIDRAGTVWRTLFGKGYEPVTIQITTYVMMTYNRAYSYCSALILFKGAGSGKNEQHWEDILNWCKIIHRCRRKFMVCFR